MYLACAINAAVMLGAAYLTRAERPIMYHYVAMAHLWWASAIIIYSGILK